MQKRSRVLLLGGVSAASIATTLWVLLVGLSPSEQVTSVSYEELTADVEAGRVDQLNIAKRVYTYRVRGSTLKKQATGPEPDLAKVRAMRPSDPAAHAPRIYFEL